jgi:hypothetical protein
MLPRRYARRRCRNGATFIPRTAGRAVVVVDLPEEVVDLPAEAAGRHEAAAAPRHGRGTRADDRVPDPKIVHRRIAPVGSRGATLR